MPDTMRLIEGDRRIGRCTGFEHALGGEPPHGLLVGGRLPDLLVAGDRVERQALGIHPAQTQPVVEADIYGAKVVGARGDEPDPGVRIDPIFIVAKQHLLAVGEQEDRAGLRRESNEKPPHGDDEETSHAS
jgi:hypothetical protein